MGNCSYILNKHVDPITDHYYDIDTYDQLYQIIQDSGVFDKSNISIYVDMTLSNVLRDGTTMHDIPNNYHNMTKTEIHNQYMYCISAIENIILKDHTTRSINMFTYGETTHDIRAMNKIYDYKTRTTYDNSNVINECNKCRDMYAGTIKSFNVSDYGRLSSYEPIIKHTIDQYNSTNMFQLCIILTDGIVDERHITNDIIEFFKASQYQIGYVCICIGNHSSDILKGIDDMEYKFIKHDVDIIKDAATRYRKFDNIQTVILQDIIQRPLVNESLEQELYRQIFMEIPRQFMYTNEWNNHTLIQYASNRRVSLQQNYFNNTIELDHII